VQGSATHESTELDELDQLPPSVLENIEPPMISAMGEVATDAPIDPVAVEALADANHHADDDRLVQPTGVSVIGVATDETLSDTYTTPTNTALIEENVKSTLVGSTPSGDGFVPQASRDMVL